MDEEDRHARRHRRLSDDSEDRISKLPDELLHDVLVRLRSARAAARTSVLSRRWRHLWAHMPELSFDAYSERRAPQSPLSSSLLDSVDAALSSYSAPALQLLSIALYTYECRLFISPGRVAPWLRFASQHVVGELHLALGSPVRRAGKGSIELELPGCGMAKTIRLGFGADVWRLRIPSTSSFASLASLSIGGARVDGGELTALVCTQCPRLRNLSLSLVELVDTLDVSIRSDTLRSLCYQAQNTRRLDVVTPRLEEVTLHHSDEARICAPKLQEVAWHGYGFDTCGHQFQDVSRCIRSLEIGGMSFAPGSLLRRFDQVGKLNLDISIPQGIEGYKIFLNETNQMPKCKELRISVMWDHHGAVTPALLHLLRSCNNTRKVSIIFFRGSDLCRRYPCRLPSCPCRLEASYRINDISLNSLEEVEITSYSSPHHLLILVEQLSRCNNTPVVKKIIMDHKTNDPPPPTKEVYEKIRNMCEPNIEVEFYEYSKRVQLENI